MNAKERAHGYGELVPKYFKVKLLLSTRQVEFFWCTHKDSHSHKKILTGCKLQAFYLFSLGEKIRTSVATNHGSTCLFLRELEAFITAKNAYYMTARLWYKEV